jgi:hypothetical protein
MQLILLHSSALSKKIHIEVLFGNSSNRPRASTSSCISPLPLPLPPSSSTAPLRSASMCGAQCGSVRQKDSMSASTSSPPASEEKQEVAPIRHCKGINNLGKVVLREVRGSSVEVPVFHSRESSGMFRLTDPGADPWRLPWFEARFVGCCPDLLLPYTAYVCF